jgi:hypothetical protein
MIELQGQPGELRFTIEITRAATGKTETVELVGRITPQEEPDDGRNPFDSSTERGD